MRRSAQRRGWRSGGRAGIIRGSARGARPLRRSTARGSAGDAGTGAVGETRVDLEHLLEDIRDAYPGSLEETIVTEIVANSLDSGARQVRLVADPTAASLTVVDDGSGMARRTLARYHDIAASSKSRGEGIGFAGVGIKLSILAAEEVLTETRRGRTHVATTWRLASRQKAPWRWTEPPGLVSGRGTAVRLRLRNPLSPLLDRGFLEATLQRHFPTLLDPLFAELLRPHYPDGVRLEVSPHVLACEEPAGERAVLAVRVGRKRKPSLVGYLRRSTEALPEEQAGIAVSTLGKTIKRGWDWLGLSPADGRRIHGVFEVPDLAECLTLNKADFIRSGARGARFLGYRKALQEAVAAQLAEWGEAPASSSEEARQRRTRPVERDLAAVLLDLAEEFPLVASLVERRAGGQKRLPMGRNGTGETGGTIRAALTAGAGLFPEAPAGGDASPGAVDDAKAPSAGSQAEAGTPPGDGSDAPAPESRHADTGAPGGGATAGGGVDWPSAGGRRRAARLGLAIRFEAREADDAPSRLVDSTVWVNERHPAYRRAAATRAEGYHVAVCVALALAPLAVEAAEIQSFVTSFLKRWGEAVERPARRRRAPGGGRRSRGLTTGAARP